MKQTNKEYAEALFILGAENDSLDRYCDDLEMIKGVTDEQGEYLKILSSPAIPLSERLSLIDGAFSGRCAEYVLYFLKLLCENNHIGELKSCIKEFESLVMDYKNRTKATVFYAEELGVSQKSRLVKKLSELSGKTVEAEYIKDSSLLGGIKVLLGDKTLDGSIKGRLNKVKGMISE